MGKDALVERFDATVTYNGSKCFEEFLVLYHHGYSNIVELYLK